MFRLELLGPVTLRCDGQALALPTHKVAALLVLLALGGPAHRARLAGWLWPDGDEAAARRNLRRELARLREAGAGGVLAGDGQVLALARPPLLSCDAWEFDAVDIDAVAATPGATAAVAALWRGPPADGLMLDGAEAFSAWLQAERERLGALRRRLMQAAAAAHEARGAPDAALAGIEALLAEDPLQEQLHREAMRLHLGAGRREAALAQYKRCRDLLQRELGLAPMAATEALAAQARGAGAPALLDVGEASRNDATAEGATQALSALAPPVPSAPPAWQVELPLTGRDDAWAALQAAWDTHRLMLIEGEAGTGKTRLASDFAAAQGAYALAQCRPGDADTPYAAIKRALRLLAGPALDAAGLPAWVCAELAHVMPELGAPSPRTATAEDRSRLHEAAVLAWQTLAAGSFDAIVIDDWHLADADSRALLATIARAPATPDTPRLLWLLRPLPEDDGPDQPQGPARELLYSLRAAGACHLRLGALDLAPLLALVRRISGAPDALHFTRRLQQATGGNPFFVVETLRHWQALGLLVRGTDGAWHTPFDDATRDYRELPLPASVRDAVLARVQRQGMATRRLLEAAALAAEPFTPALLAGACALSEVEALEAIAPALGAGLLRELGGGYAFDHDLVQAAIESTLAPERRRLVHQRLALAAEGAEAAQLAPAEIARHWEAGGRPQRGVRHRLAAAQTALALASWEAAEAQWRAALAAGPGPDEHIALLRQRWPTLQVRDDRAGLQAVLDGLQALHATWAQHPESAHAALQARTEQALMLSLGLGLRSPHTALDLADAALAGLRTDDPLRLRLQLARAQALNATARHAEAEQAVEEALAWNGPDLTPRLQAQLLHTLAYSHYSRGQPQRALVYAERTLLVWQGAGEKRLMVRPLANIGLMQSAIGDQVRAVQALQQARALAAELRMVEIHREVCNNLADIMLFYGDAAQAHALADEALGLSTAWAKPSFQVFLRGMKVQACWQQGQLGTALDTAEEALALCRAPDGAGDRADTLIDCISMALDVYTFVGDGAGAQRLLAHLAAHTGARSPHFEVKLGFNLARLALAQGDREAARAALPAAQAVPDLHEQRDQEHAVLCHAELALAGGDAAAALRWLDDWPAPQAHVEVGARRALARLQAALAGGAADPGSADDALATARSAALAAALAPQTPRPTALELHRALHAAALAAGDSEDVAAQRSAADTLLATLADGLAARPAQRASLLQRWA
jgi:DNA-binding SARP family transcriptional activator